MARIEKRWHRILGAVMVVGLLGGCDFVDPISEDPNAIPSATLDQLLTGVEVNAFFFAQGHLSRVASMWTQQMAGTDRQFVTVDSWVFTEEEMDDYYNTIYTGGGLIDIRDGYRLADEVGTARAQTIKGILALHEAFFMGMGASVWGDMVYSQAVDATYPQPELDPQSEVYAAVQARLDEAIADLNAGGSHSIGADIAFGGDADAWVKVARSLKARFYLHTGNLSSAASEAAMGIASPGDNWMSVHSSSSAEDNPWWEFMVEQRSGYISAGKYLVELLAGNGDPRLALYYGKDDAGGYSGSPPAESGAGFSGLGDAFGAQGSSIAILSCAETKLILAEARFRLGDTAAAEAALEAGIACQESRWGITVPTYFADDLLREIMTQKYIANFLSVENWMDYRRTCMPDLRSTESATGGRVGKLFPARIFYADDETQNNKNIPSANAAGNTLRKTDMENLSGFWSTYNSCIS